MSPRTPIISTSVHHIRSIRPFNSLGSKDVDGAMYDRGDFNRRESSSSSAPRLYVPPTVYVAMSPPAPIQIANFTSTALRQENLR